MLERVEWPGIEEETMNIRTLQRPLKDRYRQDATTAQITLRADGSQTDTPLSCSVDLGRAIYQAEAHQGVGGAGGAACSGDLLLGALAACAQLTCQLVATNMGIQATSIRVTVEGDMDLRGTLGLAKDVPVGFSAIRTNFAIDAPGATAEQLELLKGKTEQYCVVLQTLRQPPPIMGTWTTGDGGDLAVG